MKNLTVPALSIAGLDPSGGAGLLADARVFSTLGLYGMAVATAVTAQNTREVRDVMPLSAEKVSSQLEAVLDDITPAATKTGMLATAETAKAVAALAAEGRLGRLVVDPVLAAGSGRSLAGEGVADVIRDGLMPCCDLITPNISEAEVLAGLRITDRESARAAARALREMGAEAVCITGGHWQGEPDDLLATGEETVFLEGSRFAEAGGSHGTGCVFSAAAASFLALGEKVTEAVRKAKILTGAAIADAITPGGGMTVPLPSGQLEQRDARG